MCAFYSKCFASGLKSHFLFQDSAVGNLINCPITVWWRVNRVVDGTRRTRPSVVIVFQVASLCTVSYLQREKRFLDCEVESLLYITIPVCVCVLVRLRVCVGQRIMAA